MVKEQFKQIEEKDFDHKAILVSFNDPEVNLRLHLSFLSQNNKIEHEKDVYILSEAISLYITHYKQAGGNDADMLRSVINNLEQNFISTEDKLKKPNKKD